MLTMEHIYLIRHLRKFEGKSLRKIAEITGHDFSTVKRHVDKDDFNLGIPTKQKREGKLSPYREIVLKWLTDDKRAPHNQQHTAKRIHDRLEELYPNEKIRKKIRCKATKRIGDGHRWISATRASTR
ncbi:hypothetical protein [Clostridium tagluense]|nr:hypothetical protein [Clostridium tagluense]MBW9156988.1 hypothetical protein [Clostridium tagluense]